MLSLSKAVPERTRAIRPKLTELLALLAERRMSGGCEPDNAGTIADP